MKPKPMAAKYEEAWNKVVAKLPPWKRHIAINNFTVIDGHHIYHSEFDNQIMMGIARDVARLAESKESKFSSSDK